MARKTAGKTLIARAAPEAVESAPEAAAALARIRGLCLALPEVEERLSHGAPTFFIRGKKSFATFADNHHGDGRLAVVCAAPPGMQGDLVRAHPDRFYVPPYVGHLGWLGVRLEEAVVDWEAVADILREGYRAVAPKTLLARLAAAGPR